MSAFREKLASAIHLCESGSYVEARQLLLELLSEFPEEPQVNDGSKLPCAWIHDLLGLGSTYRCIGEYQKSIDTFPRALAFFPNSPEFNVFLAMAYYNIGEHAKTMELLLNGLVNTSHAEGILRDQRAIRSYSDKLDQIW
jgi:tetratricopeptide (TPR) repeat protein